MRATVLGVAGSVSEFRFTVLPSTACFRRMHRPPLLAPRGHYDVQTLASTDVVLQIDELGRTIG